MLLDFDILEKKFCTTKDSFRTLFTADYTTELGKKRKIWEDRIEARIHEGTMFGLKNYQFYAAADLAWDSNIITRELVPLQLYAQNKITFAALKDQIKDLPEETREQFCKKNDRGEIVGIDIPAFHKVVVNLVRSFITRRASALAVRYTKLQPLYRYETHSRSFVSKLRGDVLSQRVEMIVNSYGYRHDMIQSIREMLLYGHSLEFAATAWDKDTQYRKKARADGVDTSKDDSFEPEAYIAREGILYTRPHPSRKFWDNAYPVASINTDSGCTYMGYWDTPRMRDVLTNPVYFNRDKIQRDQTWLTTIASYKGYWELYSATAPVNFLGADMGTDVPGANNRTNNVGLYTSEMGDQTSVRCEYREKVIPKEVGLGDYPFPVWVRLVVVGGRTVVYGEVLPSTPATYWGYNEDDNRQINNGWAHDIMPWQDLMSNGLSNLQLSHRAALIKLIMLDIDLVNDPDVLKKIRETVKGEAIFNRPHLVEFKGSQLASMDEKPREALQVAETQPVQDVTMYYKSLMQIYALAERVLGMSANESAQSEPREISATESTNIAATTQTTIAFMGIGVDEAVDAKKRQIYESFEALGQSRVQVPAVNRYMKSTIRKAGFKVLDEAEDGTGSSMYVEKGQTLMGTKESLVYDYNFSSRDGSERASNAKAAEVLVNLLAQLVQFPGFAETLGKERLFMLLNEVVLLSGAGVDLRFDLQDGEPTVLPSGDPATDSKEAIEEAISQVIAAIEQNRVKTDQLELIVRQALGGAMPPATPAPGPALATAA